MFGEIKTQIKKKEKKIFSDIQSSEKSQLAECAKRKKEMEEKRAELVQHLQSLQKIKEQPNTFHLVKVSSCSLFVCSQPAALSGNYTNDFFFFFNLNHRNLGWCWTGTLRSIWKHLFSLKKYDVGNWDQTCCMCPSVLEPCLQSCSLLHLCQRAPCPHN